MPLGKKVSLSVELDYIVFIFIDRAGVIETPHKYSPLADGIVYQSEWKMSREKAMIMQWVSELGEEG